MKILGPSWSRKLPLKPGCSGDGTTTATLLAQAIIREGIKNVTAVRTPCPLNAVLKATNAVVEEIKAQARPVETRDAISQVAAISADDREIGELIAEAMEKVVKTVSSLLKNPKLLH